MRGAFAAAVTELASADPRILLLTGDLGYMALEPFSDRYPDRFFNVGVAEQNMIGIATGLAKEGFLPFAYSIVTFASLRPYEFIRNGPILHHLPVRIVGVGGGFEYGHAGATHHGLEDVGVMRIQPGITVIAPADAAQTRTAILETWNLPGPIYYRIGKNDKLSVPGLDGRFELGRLQVIREGGDVAIVAMGAISTEAVAAADRLNTRGIQCGVAVVASMNPAPVEDLIGFLSDKPLTLAVEAHYVCGGLGSLLAETIAENRLGSRLVRCGVSRSAAALTGGEQYLHRSHGLSRDDLFETALRELGMNQQ
jgi:transketolase